MLLCLCRSLSSHSQYPVGDQKEFVQRGLRAHFMICAILQRDPHHNGQTQADLLVLMLVDLMLSASSPHISSAEHT